MNEEARMWEAAANAEKLNNQETRGDDSMIPEHVAKLRENVDVWNAWRHNAWRHNPGARPDLGGADLSGADLRDANLTRANLHRAALGGAALGGADLTDAHLRGAHLRYAHLVGANLQGANLVGANLTDANLTDANLTYANLVGANLVGANLRDTVGFDPRRWVALYERKYLPGVQHAYKMVTEHGYGPYQGGINYLGAMNSGGAIKVEGANTDEHTDCGAGINVATLAWCLRERRPEHRILIVAFEASDIAAIPWTSDGKFRLRRCRVVGEYQQESG